MYNKGTFSQVFARLTVIVAVLALLGLILGLSQEGLPQAEQGTIIIPPTDEVQVSISVPKSVYQPREQIQIFIQTSATNVSQLYLNVVDIDAAGKCTLIFPNAFSPNPLVPVGSFALPDKTSYGFVVVPPAGMEYVQVFASPDPLDLRQLFNTPSTSNDPFPTLCTSPQDFAQQVRNAIQRSITVGRIATAFTSFRIVTQPPVNRPPVAFKTVDLDGYFNGRHTTSLQEFFTRDHVEFRGIPFQIKRSGYNALQTPVDQRKSLKLDISESGVKNIYFLGYGTYLAEGFGHKRLYCDDISHFSFTIKYADGTTAEKFPVDVVLNRREWADILRADGAVASFKARPIAHIHLFKLPTDASKQIDYISMNDKHEEGQYVVYAMTLEEQRERSYKSDERGILIYVLSTRDDQHSEIRWYTGPNHLRPIVALLESKGYSVEVLDEVTLPTITLDKMKEYSQVWILEGDPDNQVEVTAREASDLLTYYESGYGVWISAEADRRPIDGGVWNEDATVFANAFGVSFEGFVTSPRKSQSVSSRHPLFSGVSEIRFDKDVSYLKTSNPSLRMIWRYSGGYPGVGVLSEAGSGKGRAIFDSGWMLGWAYWEGLRGVHDDNLKFVANVARWMAGSDDHSPPTEKEITFQGTAIKEEGTYVVWWLVGVDKLISGPQPCESPLQVIIGGGVLPKGYVDPDIEEGDKVEIYGEYFTDGECGVHLPQSHHYIKKIDGAEKYDLRVQVYDSATGRMISGAAVYVDSDPTPKGITGPRGEVTITVSKGSHTIRASKTGFEQGSWSGTVDHDMGVTLSLDPADSAQNKPPAADFTWTPREPNVGETVSYTDQSGDPDGEVVYWMWMFGDGASHQGADATHVYQKSGTYLLCLQVADDDGATNIACEEIKVKEDEGLYRLRVQVHDAVTGDMISGASVYADDDPAPKGITDGKGEVTIAISQGYHTIRASKAGYEEGSWNGEITKDMGIAIPLTPSERCRNVVIRGNVAGDPNYDEGHFDVRIEEVVENPVRASNVAPGNTITVYTDSAKLYELKDGDSVEVSAIWDTDLYSLPSERGCDYIKKISEVPIKFVGEVVVFYGGMIPGPVNPDPNITKAADALGADIKVEQVISGTGISHGDIVQIVWQTDFGPCFRWDVEPDIQKGDRVEVYDTGNFCTSYVMPATLPDLSISVENISLRSTNERFTSIHAITHNLGSTEATNITIRFFDGKPDSGGKQLGHDSLIDSIPSHSTGVAELQLPSEVEISGLYVFIDPDDTVPESDETNNMTFAHVVSINAFSEYDSFYKYTHLEGDDPVIIGALVGEIIDEKLLLIDNANVEFKINLDGKRVTGKQITGPQGRVYFDLSTLPDGEYSIQLRAYSDEEHLVSPTVTKKFSVIETDMDVRGYMVPSSGIEREFDLYKDKRPDYYVRIGGKVEARLHISADVQLDDTKLLFNPLDYFRGAAYQRDLGNISPGGSRTFSLDFEVRNGERYAVVEEQNNDYSYLAMYVSKVTPIVHLFFKDEDGKPHHAVRQLDYGPNTYSRVFPYSPSGPSTDAVTLSSGQLRTIETLALEYGSKAFHKETTIRMLSFDQMVRMGNAITLFNLAHKGLFLGLAIDQTIKDLKAPPSTARQIKGVRDTVAVSAGLIGVANLVINVASLPLATVPPVYFLAASATSAGLSLLADHVEREELDRKEAYAKDMAELPIDLLGESIRKSLFTVLEETESGSFFQKKNSLRIEFFNTLTHERKLYYQLETLSDSGHVLDNIVDEMPISAADQRNFGASQKGWNHGSYILRYYVEESDESREITSILRNAVGIRDILFSNDSGVRRAVFSPGETVNITLNYMNGRESPVEVVSNVSIRAPNGETISIEDDRFTLDPPKDPSDDGLQPTTIKWSLPSNAKSGRYTVEFSLWDPPTTETYDQSDYYEFTVYNSGAHSLTVQATCPVDLSLIDPNERKITKHANKIPGATYEEVDINGDGEADDRIYVPNRLSGNYYIKMVPEPNASPTDTYTLEVSAGGETTTLAKNVRISNIPDQPYKIESTDEGVRPVTERNGMGLLVGIIAGILALGIMVFLVWRFRISASI